jgi:parallel beta-helix repeat protein
MAAILLGNPDFGTTVYTSPGGNNGSINEQVLTDHISNTNIHLSSTDRTKIDNLPTNTNQSLSTLTGLVTINPSVFTTNLVGQNITTPQQLARAVDLLVIPTHDPVTIGGDVNGLSIIGQVLSLTIATSSHSGALSSTDWTVFNSKEPAISTGTTLQYYRGDKTWITLNSSIVPELTNLYFTEGRVRSTLLTGLSMVNTSITSSDSILSATGKLQGQINAFSTHSPVTIGTANGLTLSGQQISLATATSIHAGALPTLSGDNTQVLRGDGTWGTIVTPGVTQLCSYDYLVEKISATYYATAGPNTGRTSYSGSNFVTVLTSAMSQLSSGGYIKIKNGLYDNLDFITVPYSNIILEGSGKYTTILKLKASADIGVTDAKGLINGSSINNLVIKDLSLDGNGSNQTKIDNGASTTAQLSGILWSYTSVSTTTGLQVLNCYIHDFTVFGIFTADFSTNSYINNCEIANNYWNNITIVSNNNIISDCHMRGSSDVSVTLYGNNNSIVNCIIDDMNQTFGSINSSWGIGMESTSYPKGCSIINCKITGPTTKEGIHLNNGAKECIVQGNYIHDLNSTYSIGIFLEDCNYSSIIDNLIRTIHNQGIYLSTCTYCLVSNNKIDNTGYYCIDFQNGASYNTFTNNTVDGSETINIVSGANYNNITNNYIKQTSGAIIDTGTGTLLSNNFDLSSRSWLDNKISPSFIEVQNYFYIGDANTDGSWRFTISGANLNFEKRISGTWTMEAQIIG